MKFSKKCAAAVAGIGLAAISFGAAAPTASAAVIINEIYPGGGSGTAAAFTRDYVELYNSGATAVDLTGWRVTYASATGNYGTNDIASFGAGSFIAAGETLLLVSGAAGAAGVPVPNANYYNSGSTGSMSATAGSVKLFDAASASVDTVGYGTTVTSPDAATIPKFEGAAAPAPTAGNLTSLNRTLFADTNNNAADFSNQTPSPTAGATSVVVPVPEPTAIALLGVVGLGALRRRRA